MPKMPRTLCYIFHRLAKIAQLCKTSAYTATTLSVLWWCWSQVKGCCLTLLLGKIFTWNDLHFCIFLVNPTSVSNLTFFGRSMNRRFQWYMFIQKYCQLFTHELNTFLFKNTPFRPVETKNPKHPPHLWTRGPISNTSIPWLTPLSTANGIRNSGSNHPFCHNTFSEPTDSRTDSIGDRWVKRVRMSYCIDREWFANNGKYLEVSALLISSFLLLFFCRCQESMWRSLALHSSMLPLGHCMIKYYNKPYWHDASRLRSGKNSRCYN